MKHSLELAKEVQLKLLPEKAPAARGFDIAGVSRYCDETGGDYFDYLALPGDRQNTLGIVVGDVSDHGVHAALLMATARAFLRLRASQPGSIDAVVTDVNRHLAEDIAEGGQFMTLFFLAIAPGEDGVEWVRAGHDPGVWYDPALDRMEDLKGPGIPLGIEGRFHYQANRKGGLTRGQIIVLSTDGIWEARNRAGRIYGRERFRNAIRRHAAGSAASIVQAVVEDVDAFQEGVKAEDDITMVAIKVLADA